MTPTHIVQTFCALDIIAGVLLLRTGLRFRQRIYTAMGGILLTLGGAILTLLLA